MENYKKGKNVEEPLDRDKIPIPNLPTNFLWMQVRGGSKIRNLLTHAINEFPEVKNVVWTGIGPSVGKCITCAEIMKREFSNSLHQITKLCYRKVDEYWDPLLPELDQLVVKRKLPMVHIYLSFESLDKEETGYQAPGESISFNKNGQSSSNKKQLQNRKPEGSNQPRNQKNRNKGKVKKGPNSNDSSSSNMRHENNKNS